MRTECRRRITGTLLLGLMLIRAVPAAAEEVGFRLDRSPDKLQIVLLWHEPVEPVPGPGDRELLIRFGRAAEVTGVEQLPLLAPDWIESVSGGYDTLLLRAAREVDFSVRRADFGIVVSLVPAKRPERSGGPDEERAEIRLDLLDARLSADTGHVKAASEALRRLAEDHPDDPDVLTSLANLESNVGRWRRAAALYDRVLLVSPANEDIREARDRLLREQGSRAAVEYTRKVVADAWQEQSGRAAGQVLFGYGLRAGASYEVNHVRTGTVRLEGGETGTFDGFRRRSDVYLQQTLENGAQFTGTFHADERNRGLGLAFAYPDRLGFSCAAMEFHRPYWEFVEGLVAHGFRDRIEATREQRFSPRWSAWVTGAINRYGLASEGSTASSAGVAGGLNYLLAKRPVIALQYGFDGEYQMTSRLLLDPGGNLYSPIPLVSREVHAFDISVAASLSRSLRVDGFGGYAVDRLGGTGPHVGVRLAGDLSRHLEVRAHYERRLSSVNTGRLVNQFTGRVLWRQGR